MRFHKLEWAGKPPRWQTVCGADSADHSVHGWPCEDCAAIVARLPDDVHPVQAVLDVDAGELQGHVLRHWRHPVIYDADADLSELDHASLVFGSRAKARKLLHGRRRYWRRRL